MDLKVWFGSICLNCSFKPNRLCVCACNTDFFLLHSHDDHVNTEPKWSVWSHCVTNICNFIFVFLEMPDMHELVSQSEFHCDPDLLHSQPTTTIFCTHSEFMSGRPNCQSQRKSNVPLTHRSESTERIQNVRIVFLHISINSNAVHVSQTRLGDPLGAVSGLTVSVRGWDWLVG